MAVLTSPAPLRKGHRRRVSLKIKRAGRSNGISSVLGPFSYSGILRVSAWGNASLRYREYDALVSFHLTREGGKEGAWSTRSEDQAETDKELAQKRGDAKERKSAQPRDTLRSPPDGAR